MNLPKIAVPKKIEPCPIVDSVVELRFESSLPLQLIPGMVYKTFASSGYSEIQNLPIIEVPPMVRDNDPNLRFAPHYKLMGDGFIVQVGPRVFSISCPKEYRGWQKFEEEISRSFLAIKQLNIIQKPLRLGVRYINFFEHDTTFDKLRLEMKLGGQSLATGKSILRTEFDSEGFKVVLQLMNCARVNNSATDGTVVDIDVIREDGTDLLAEFGSIVKLAHAQEKQIFFGIIKEDFLKTLHPEYDR